MRDSFEKGRHRPQKLGGDGGFDVPTPRAAAGLVGLQGERSSPAHTFQMRHCGIRPSKGDACRLHGAEDCDLG